MQLVIAILIAMFALYQGSAYAKSIGGKVVSTDAIAQTITISQANAETGAEESVVVSVNDSTTYSGVDALAGLNEGDEVWVEAEEDPATKAWVVSSLQCNKETAIVAPVATAETVQVTQ